MQKLMTLIGLLLVGCTTLDARNQDKVEESVVLTQLSLAVAQLDTGEAEKAFTTIKPLLKKYPEDPKVITLAGMIHLSLANNEIALNLLRKSYRLDPKTATALNLSSALIGSGKYLRARNVLRKIISKDKEYQYIERLYHNLGLAYEKDGKTKSAVKYYKKAIGENPAFYLSLFQLAKVHKKKGNKRLTRGYLGRAIRSCQSCYDPVHILATMHINAGRPSKAKKVIHHFLKSRFSTEADKKTATLLLKTAQKATIKTKRRRR